MNHTELDALLGRIARHDRDAFEALYRCLERPVFKFIHSRLNDPFQSSDVLHDVFLDVWRNAGTFQGRSTVRSWVFSIAYRKTIDIFRRQKRVADVDEMPDLPDESPPASEVVWAQEESDMLKQCLASLTPDHRTAVELTFYHDMSYAEASVAMGVPEGTVKTRVFHAKKLLLRCLQSKLNAKVR